MRYDSYESKIVKIAKFFKLIFKHRVKIIISMAIMLTMTVTLLATRGIIVGAKECPDEIFYGEKLNYSAGAFISKTRYEYSSDGDKWTSEQPIEPGEYYVRAVAKATFGERYGEKQKFKILPKPIDITISDTNVQYGSTPILTAALEYNDVISCDRFIYEATELLGKREVAPDINNLKILDKKGNDVTHCYVISTASATINVIPRNVELIITDAQKVYDGTALVPLEYTMSDGALVNGDTIEVQLFGSQILAGSSLSDASYTFYDKDGNDVSALYNLTVRRGSLTVSQREITLSSYGSVKFYDANPLSHESHSMTGTLVAGHTLEVFGWDSITDAGSIKNTFVFRIVDENGTDPNEILKNYKVTVSFGTLTVEPRPVIITTGSHTTRYDATSRSYGAEDMTASAVAGNSESGLCPGHEIIVMNRASYKNVADSGKNDIPFEIYSGKTPINKNNYAIDLRLGDIVIEPRPVVITTGTHSFTYDDTYHFFSGDDILASSVPGDANSGLCRGHFIAATLATRFKNVADSGANDIQYEILENGTPVDKANYDITPVIGSVTVNPIYITVESPDRFISYDGQDHDGVATGADIIIKSGHLVPSHYFIITQKTSVCDVATDVKNYFELEILGSDNLPRSANYVITYQYGKITVTPPSLVIRMSSESVVYDGSFISIGYDSIEGLVFGHTLTISSMTSEKNVGKYDNTITAYNIVDAAGNPVKHNYTSVTIIDGELEITPRRVMLISASDSKIYDAKPLAAESWVCYAGYPNSSYYALPQGFTVKEGIEGYFSSITNVGTVDNVYTGSLYILDENGVDASANFIIETSFGTLTINPRPITITTASDSFVYDGKTHSYGMAHITAEPYTPGSDRGLCEGHSIEVTKTANFKDVKDSGLNVIEYEFTDGNIYIDKNNYVITDVHGIVTVTPRPIVITTPTDSFIYDDNIHSYGTISAEPYVQGTDRGLCEGHSIVVTKTADFREVKDSGANIIEYEIRNNRSEVIDKENYAITDVHGTVTVAPRPLTITTVSDAFVYDGKEHRYGFKNGDITAEAYNPSGYRGLCRNHLLVATGEKVFTDVADSGRNSIPFEIRKFDTVIDLNNYSIYENYGSVTISKRPIIITTVSDAFVYDGKAHEYGSRPGDIVAEPYVPGTDRGLCEGHSIFVTAYSVFKNVSDSGLNEIHFEFKRGNVTINKNNYEIDANYGSVTISQRPIIITTVSDSFVYDGKTHIYGNRAGDIVAEPYTPGSNRGLCEGHRISVTQTSAFKNVIDSGINAIAYEFKAGDTVIDKNNYAITENLGSVNIDLRPITLTSQSYNAPYDGTDKNLNDIYVSDTEGLGLCDGHSILAYDKIYTGIVYNVQNDVAFDILDENRQTAKLNYDITYNKGTVTIYPIQLIVKTDSKSWPYDGLEHSAPSFTFEPDSAALLPGHNIIVSSASVIKDVGSIQNVLVLKVIDSKTLADLTQFYEIDQRYGTLEIYDDTNVVIPPVLPEDPTIGLPDGDGDGDGDGEASVIFVIKSDTTGIIYLKQASYGDYTGKGWLKADEYSELILDYASAYYLGSMAAMNEDLKLSSVVIESKTGIYVLPYYAMAKNSPQTSDTVVSGDASTPYTVYFYANLNGANLPVALMEFERDYREFVYREYLTIDNETLAYMKSIIRSKGFTKNDLQAVADYIKSSAKYNLEYDRNLDKESNIVVAFLDKYGEGICQHYASAATMLYRALGIPARYTVGYVGNAKAGVETEITSKEAHAWVEIYLDGLGWVQVEVTGSADADGGEEEEEDEPYLAGSKITVRPLSQAKEYDGIPLYAQDIVDMSDEILRALHDHGYTFEIKASGSQTQIGVGKSYVDSFKIFDKQGNDVTSYYNVNYETGTLHVSYAIVEIFLYEKDYLYSDNAYSFSNNDYFVTKISDDLLFEMIEINISLTDAGWINSEDINRDPTKYLSYRIVTKNGEDVTDSCTVRAVAYPDGGQYDVLKINKRHITVKTGSSTKEYNSENPVPLTNDTYYMSYGQLGVGHTLYVDVIGSQTEPGQTENTINKSATKIVDANGIDRTKNYVINYELGTLTVTD